MKLAQRRSIMKTFICSQFGYCALSRKINNRINSLHERALRVAHKDYIATFSVLLSKEKSVIIHQRSLLILATDTLRQENELNPEIMEEILYLKTWTKIFKIIHI